MHLALPLAVLSLLSTAHANGWSKTKSAPDGPDKLEQCGCWPIYQAMLRCQKLPRHAPLTKADDHIRKCICIPNPDGWYTSLNGCKACLSPGSYDDDDFFDNMARTISQLFVSCTETGGGITSDGGSICASNAMGKACTGLREGGETGEKSWASFQVFGSDGRSGNGSQVLNIAEYKEGGGEESSSSSSALTGVSVPTSVVGVELTAATSASMTATSTSTTAASSATSTLALSSGMGGKELRDQFWWTVSLVVGISLLSKGL